jgi:hypothetical protein
VETGHSHRSLDFKKLKGSGGNRFSVRVGDHHRSIGQLVGDTVEWVWMAAMKIITTWFRI